MKESYQSTCYQRFRHIASFPADEIPTDYPHKFINNVMNNLQEKSKETDDYIIPPGFLHVLLNVVLVDIPHCPKNEKLAKHFIKSLMFSLIINAVFVLRGPIRKLNGRLN